MPLLKETYDKVKNIVKGAELQTEAKSVITRVANTYENRIPNKTLSDVFRENMISLGVDYPEENEPKAGGGSTDFGNVSQVMPALSAYINIGDVVLHSPQGTEATGKDEAYEVMLLGAKGLALTAVDLITKPDLLEKAEQEQRQRVKEQ